MYRHFKNVCFGVDIDKCLQLHTEESLNTMELDYKSIYEHFPKATFVCDPRTGRIIYCNKAAEAITRRRKGELIGLHHLKLYPRSEVKNNRARFKQAAGEQDAKDYESYILTRQGKSIPVMIRTWITKADDNDMVVQVVIENTVECTEEKAQTIEPESNLAIMLDAIQDIAIEIDLTGRITYINTAALKALGWEPEGIIGTDLSIHLPPDDSPFIKKALASLKVGKPITNHELKLKGSDGLYRKVPAVFAPQMDRGKAHILSIDTKHIATAFDSWGTKEDRFQVLFELIPDPAFIVSPDGKMVQVNKAFSDRTGYSNEDIAGMPLLSPNPELELIPQEDIPKILDTFMKSLTGEEVPMYPIRVMAKDGHTIWAELNASTIAQDGDMLGIARDITDRKDAEEQLYELKRKYQSLYDTAPEAILLVDLTGMVIDCNSMAERLGGLSRSELIGMPIIELGKLHEDDVEAYSKLFERAKSEEDVESLEIRTVDADGQISWHELSSSLLTKNDDITAIQVIMRDITDRKHAEEHLKQSEDMLKDLVHKLKLAQEELSTPVVQVWDRILALPLIGVVDTHRAQQIMDILLTTIVETQSKLVIVDVTGVASMDTEVTNHLIRTVHSTRLLGAECVITGVKPEVAQTMVHLGVDLGRLIIRSDIQDGLRWGLNKLGYEIETDGQLKLGRRQSAQVRSDSAPEPSAQRT